MNKSATSSLLGASATRLTRFANHAQTRTMRAQQSVTMIDTMGLRVKAQTPAAQRMARKSFPLAPSCRRGRRQPSKGSGQSRMPHIAARPAPLQRPATSPDAPLRKGSKLAFNIHTRTGLVGHECPKVQGSIASPLGRPGPRLGQCSPFLSPLVRPRGSRQTSENPQSDHTGRRTERSRTHTMRTRIFERQRRPHSRRSTQAQAAHGG